MVAIAILFVWLGGKAVATLAGSAAILVAIPLIAGRVAKAWAMPRLRAAMRDGSYARRYVYVENDGTPREITTAELDYLHTKFDGPDGNRPYIKRRYSSKTPDGRLRGFLLREKLPVHIKVSPAPQEDPSTGNPYRGAYIQHLREHGIE